MTREEAITALSDRDNFLWWEMSKEEREYYSEVFDMAISALSAEREKGEWVYDGDCIHCNNCKSAFNNLTGFNFCPNCGVDMRGEK